MKSKFPENPHLKKKKTTKRPKPAPKLPKQKQITKKAPVSSIPLNIVSFVPLPHTHHRILTPTTFSQIIDYARIADTVVFSSFNSTEMQFISVLKTHPLPNVLYSGSVCNASRVLRKELGIRVGNSNLKRIGVKFGRNKHFLYGFLFGMINKGVVKGFVRGVGLNLDKVHIVGIGDFDVLSVTVVSENNENRQIGLSEEDGKENNGDRFNLNDENDSKFIDEESVYNNSDDYKLSEEDDLESIDGNVKNKNNLELIDKDSVCSENSSESIDEKKGLNVEDLKRKYKKKYLKKEEEKIYKFKAGASIEIKLKDAGWIEQEVIITDYEKIERMSGYLGVCGVTHINTRYPLIVSSGIFRYISVPYLHEEWIEKKRSDDGSNGVIIYGIKGRMCMFSSLKSKLDDEENNKTGVVKKESNNNTSFGVRHVGFGLLRKSENKLLTKCDLVGYVIKVHNKTSYVKDMFNTKEEGIKFVGSVITSASGIKGIIKRIEKNGVFRATFEGRLNLNDSVILSTFFNEKVCDVVEFKTEEYDGLKVEKREPNTSIKKRKKVLKIVEKKKIIPNFISKKLGLEQREVIRNRIVIPKRPDEIYADEIIELRRIKDEEINKIDLEEKLRKEKEEERKKEFVRESIKKNYIKKKRKMK